MRWLVIAGVVLMLGGLFGVMNACLSSGTSSRRDAVTSAPTQTQAPPQTPAPPTPTPNGSDDGRTLWGAFAGLTLAVGAGMVAVGAGRWTRPVPSKDRPANPWNEQPKDSGEPPVGLV